MSIAKQIHAFLEVSEAFLGQSGIGLLNDGLSSLEGVGSARGARTLVAGVQLNRKTSANGDNSGGNGHGYDHGNDAVPVRVLDGV